MKGRQFVHRKGDGSMKILVYGAGVLGSYLAYELDKGGHDVTILARGARYEALKSNGLVVRHYVQRKTTSTSIKVIDSFKEDDYYDAVFVAMQRTQIDSVLQSISANKSCKLYILVGNNGTADETYERIRKNSVVNPTVLFAFQGCGGRREGDKVISIHMKKTSFSIGALSGDTSYRRIIDDIFASTSFKLYHSPNIDGWLKYHLAFIMPLVYGTHWAKGNLKLLSKNKEMINETIDAIEEGYEVIKACGYPVEPKEDEDYVKRNRRKLYWLIKIMSATPIGKLAVGDHSMSAIEEMNCLNDEFDRLKKKAAISTPNWDRLQENLIKQ